MLKVKASSTFKNIFSHIVVNNWKELKSLRKINHMTLKIIAWETEQANSQKKLAFSQLNVAKAPLLMDLTGFHFIVFKITQVMHE